MLSTRFENLKFHFGEQENEDEDEEEEKRGKSLSVKHPILQTASCFTSIRCLRCAGYNEY